MSFSFVFYLVRLKQIFPIKNRVQGVKGPRVQVKDEEDEPLVLELRILKTIF